MRSFARRLYNDMLTEIETCRSRHLPPAKEVEACHHIANRHWTMLREEFKKFPLASPAEEIHFFKCTKPLFIAEIEYYSLLYHALLFKPFDPLEEQAFWQREARRFERFCEEHRTFLHQVETGDTANDHRLFLRTAGLTSGAEQVLHDPEAVASVGPEYILSTAKALERYEVYVRTRMEAAND